MALTSDNVRVAVTGAVSVAPTTATAPTTASAALVGFVDLGYISEDGVTETRDRSTNKIKAWQGAATVREVVTDAGLTYDFTLIETSEASLELYYGSAVDTADGSIDINPGSTGGRQSFVIDVVDGDQFIRTYIAEGEVSAVGEQVYANGEPIGYPVTITAYDATGSGTVATKFYSALDTV